MNGHIECENPIPDSSGLRNSFAPDFVLLLHDILTCSGVLCVLRITGESVCTVGL